MEQDTKVKIDDMEVKRREYQMTKAGHAIEFLSNHVGRVGHNYGMAIDPEDKWKGVPDEHDAVLHKTPPEIREPLIKALAAAAKYLEMVFNSDCGDRGSEELPSHCPPGATTQESTRGDSSPVE